MPGISVEQAITMREQAPELYDLWLKIAREKAATANYVDRAPYEVPERLAASGRTRALAALTVVLSFCGYLAWLGGPGPYIGGLIAILDLCAMLGIFFGLRPDRLGDGRTGRTGRKPLARGQLIPRLTMAQRTAGSPSQTADSAMALGEIRAAPGGYRTTRCPEPGGPCAASLMARGPGEPRAAPDGFLLWPVPRSSFRPC